MFNEVATGMQQTDWGGIATLVGAIVAGLGVLATTAMQVLTYLDNRHAKLAAARREEKLDQVASAVGAQPPQ